MNTSRILTRRTGSVCFSCRRALLRQFSSTPAPFAATFQSYPLPSYPPSPPRSVSGADTSISRHMQSPPLPEVHETRPPRLQPGSLTSGAIKPPPPSSSTIPEQQAQQSKPSFAKTSPASSPSTPSSAPRKTPETSSTTKATAATAAAAPAPAPATPTQTQTPKPRSKLRAPRKAAMKLTSTAVEHLREMLDQPEPKLIKVGVRNRGCSGLAYHLEYVDKAGAFDETVEQDGVKVLIDSKALFSIIGSEMDWVEDKLSQRFVFRNPNIKEQCGCGESFMV